MSEIQFEIQGEEAVEAAEALSQIDGLSAEWQPAADAPTRELTLATVVTVLTIAKTSLEIAKLVHDWYARRKQQGRIEKVIIKARNGKRITLEKASIEDIRKTLEQ